MLPFIPLHFSYGMYWQSEKKDLLNSNTSSTCPNNMVNFGPLAAEIGLQFGTPANFNGFHVLAALRHGTLVVGVSQTAALNRGCHIYSAGRPSCWALAHNLVGLDVKCLLYFSQTFRSDATIIWDVVHATLTWLEFAKVLLLFSGGDRSKKDAVNMRIFPGWSQALISFSGLTLLVV